MNAGYLVYTRSVNASSGKVFEHYGNEEEDKDYAKDKLYYYKYRSKLYLKYF